MSEHFGGFSRESQAIAAVGTYTVLVCYFDRGGGERETVYSTRYQGCRGTYKIASADVCFCLWLGEKLNRPITVLMAKLGGKNALHAPKIPGIHQVSHWSA